MDEGYLKKKLSNVKAIKGSATLTPPSNVDALQSSASMSVLDNLGEGPINGLVDDRGLPVNNINILEAVFLDGTPVKPREVNANVTLTGIPPNNIQLVGRLERDSIRSAFQNIRSKLQETANTNLASTVLSNRKVQELDTDLSNLLEFIKTPSNLGRYGFIQYHYDGIYGSGDLIYSRNAYDGVNNESYLDTAFDLDTYLGDQKQKRVIEDEDGNKLSIPKSFSYGYQKYFQSSMYNSDTSVRAPDVGQDGKVGLKYLTSGFAGGGITFFDLGSFSGANVVTQVRDPSLDGYEPVAPADQVFGLRTGLTGFRYNGYAGESMTLLRDTQRGSVHSTFVTGNIGHGTDSRTSIPTTTTYEFVGFFKAKSGAGTYTFETSSDDRLHIWIGENSREYNFTTDNRTDTNDHNLGERTFSLNLSANVFVPFRCIVGNNAGPGDMRLRISPPGTSSYTSFADETGYFFHRPDTGVYVSGLSWSDFYNPGEPSRSYSSIFNNDAVGAGHARSRIDSFQAWSAATNTDPNDYVQVDYGSITNLQGVVTQGRDNAAQWVSQFRLSGSGTYGWEFLGTYTGNSDQHTIKINLFTGDGLVITGARDLRYLRFFPTDYQAHKSMRVGLLGYRKDPQYDIDLDSDKNVVSGYVAEAYRGVTGLNSGVFIVDKTDSALGSKLLSGQNSGYDVFVHDGSNISLSQTTPNQIEPPRGQTNGLKLNLGFQSDLESKYNYSNIDFDFRNGMEFQSVMAGYEEGYQDFDVRKKLYGPLEFGGSATQGGGSGYADTRAGGEFSNWMLNPPLQHDSYPYTHTIKRMGVQKAIPTIAIEGLSDTIDDGDDAGVQKAERLDLKYTIGFEGGVTGAVGALLSGGNTIEQIALGTFESSQTQIFEGIVISNFLNTYTGINSLPTNKSLRNMRINSTDIPGLNSTLISNFDLESNALVFPGDTWREPNRFLKVEKLSFETNSTLIARECSLSYVSEVIGEKFSYPFSALAGTTFDARNFAVQPSREFMIRGREIMIPSNYHPLKPNGEDKRFITNSSTYGIRDIYQFTGSNFAQNTEEINIGTANLDISLKAVLGDYRDIATYHKYFLSKAGSQYEQNGVGFFTREISNEPHIGCHVSKSTTDNVDRELSVNIQDRVEAGAVIPREYHDIIYSDHGQSFRQGTIHNPPNYTYDGAAGARKAGSVQNIHIELDIILGKNVVDGVTKHNTLLWTGGSHERFELEIRTDGRMQIVYIAPSGSGLSHIENQSTRTFHPFEILKLKIFGNMEDGVVVTDRTDNSTIVEATTSDWAQYITYAETNNVDVKIAYATPYVLGIHTQQYGFGAIIKLKIVDDTANPTTYEYDNPGRVGGEFSIGAMSNGNTNRFAITQYFRQDSFLMQLLLVGTSITFNLSNQDGIIGTQTGTMSTARGSISFGSAAGNMRIGMWGASPTSVRGPGDETLIADVKIKKNNKLLHHLDGTIIDTVRNGKMYREKIGGNHFDFFYQNLTIQGVQDENNQFFGINKEQIYIGDWDGTFKLGWTDNPAWILYDLMVNPIYGIGNNIDDREDINIFNLYNIGRYCDAVDSEGFFEGLPDSTNGLEPRFSCNLRIGETKNAFETIGNLASIFRGFTYWDGLGLNFAIDKPKEVTAIFNNGNVFDGIFEYGDVAKSARFTRVEVPYADATDQYTLKMEYVEDEDSIRKHGVVTNVLNGIGCTSKSQARRMGKYVLLSNSMETEIVSFKAGLEAIFLEPGNIIRVDDEMKHFEVNYSKILNIKSGAPNPYIDLENTIKASSIQTGINGGLYVYNNQKQDELKDLYDIVKFKTAYTFGENSDTYSGVLAQGLIDRQQAARISKFTVTGSVVENSTENYVRCYLDTGTNSNYTDITGVRVGTFANVELTNNVDTEYKIIKKSQIEPNLFEIQALQYESGKFTETESEDFDIEENTYNIGILANTINRPSAPTVVHNQFLENDLSYSITGEITAANNSNETSYRVVLYRTNQSGPYLQKEFQRENDDTTFFKMFGLTDGSYTVQVTALRNPESSKTANSRFQIETLANIYSHTLIDDIKLDDQLSGASYQRISGSGSGVGSTIDRDVIYQLSFSDMKGRHFSVERFPKYTIDVYTSTGSDWIPVASGHRLDTYTFREPRNYQSFTGFQSGFKMKFELKESGTLIDSAFYDTTIT